METDSRHRWRNWSRNVSAKPSSIERPESESAVQELVRSCHADDQTVRVVGAGHSWTPLAATDEVLVSLENLTGVIDIDRADRTATVAGGTTLEDAAEEFHRANLAMPNLGDVAQQTIAGAFATGTHGTGPAFENLAGRLIGGRLVTGTGNIRTFDAESDQELLAALKVSLGTLGIFTKLQLELEPTYKLERREYCTSFEEFWPHFERLVSDNRHFDFYWYPRSDEVKIRLLNGPGGGTDAADLTYAESVKHETDWWHQIIPVHDDIGRRFEEMEYAVPRGRATEFIPEARDRIREQWRADVGWRTLVRTVAEDDAFLSNEYGRDTVTMGFIQNAELEYEPYFEDLERIARAFDGRPHWGKRHSLRGEELRRLYPEFQSFLDVRRRFDPDGVFLTRYMRELLGIETQDPPEGDD